MSSTTTVHDVVPRRQWLYSSYLEYKTTQDRLDHWLTETAGWSSTRQSLEDGTVVTYKLSANDRLWMALKIRQLPTAKVPLWIIQALEAILRQRRRCAHWYKARIVSGEDVLSYTDHQHMIEVFERIHHLFVPLSLRQHPPQRSTTSTQTDKQPSFDEVAVEYQPDVDMILCQDSQSQAVIQPRL